MDSGLFYSDTLGWHTEGERGFVMDGRNNEVALRDDIHSDEHVVVEVAVVLAAQHAEVGNLAVAAVAVSIAHAVGHDYEAVGDDGILALAVDLLECAHRGRTFAVMFRRGRGV